MTREDVLRAVEERDVKFIRLWFTDIQGRLKSFALPVEELETALERGVRFDGSSITGFNPVEESDMVAVPDPATFAILPYRPQEQAVARMLCDIRTLEGLFESLATRDLRIYAEAQDDHVYHYQEHSGGLGVDLVVVQANGGWAGFQVRLGGALIDEAAAALTRMATTRAVHPSMALAVITASEYGYRRLDDVWVVPLGCLGP